MLNESATVHKKFIKQNICELFFYLLCLTHEKKDLIRFSTRISVQKLQKKNHLIFSCSCEKKQHFSRGGVL